MILYIYIGEGDNMDNIKELAKWIKESKKTVFFGGAGVSTESGLKDFRSKDGLYNMKYDYPPEEILSHHFFIEHPEEFYKFYKDKLNSLNYKPNKAHEVLTKLEKNNLLSTIITQNIDGFDTSSGSPSVIELHGTVLKNHCTKCHKFYDAEYVFNSEGIPRCTDDNAIKEISTADLLIIGGTSLNVYPAAGFINYFNGKHIVLINKDITPYDNICSLVINDSIGKVFGELEKELGL